MADRWSALLAKVERVPSYQLQSDSSRFLSLSSLRSLRSWVEHNGRSWTLSASCRKGGCTPAQAISFFPVLVSGCLIYLWSSLSSIFVSFQPKRCSRGCRGDRSD